MYKFTKHTGERYQTKKFLESQEAEHTREARQTIVKALGLKKEYRDVPTEDFIHIIQRGIRGDTTSTKKDSGIRGLSIVHPIDSQDVPEQVIDKARGTVIYQMKDVVVKPIETKKTLYYDELSVIQGKIVVDNGLGGVISFPVKEVMIKPYIEGTYLRICLEGTEGVGKVRVYTSKNLVPQGLVKKFEGGTVVTELRGPAKWGDHHTPFMTDFDTIIEAAAPNLLDKLFPKGSIWSPWCYPCILVTQERVRATQEYVGKPYLIMLDPEEQWDINAPARSLKDTGTEHPYATDLSEFGFQEFMPVERRDTKPYILYQRTSWTPEQANAHLRGDESITERKLAGGGKLIVYGPAIIGTRIRFNRLAFHIESSGWRHREAIVGNLPSLYDAFLEDLHDKDVSKSGTAIKVFLEKYPLMELPSSREDIVKLNKLIMSGGKPKVKLITGVSMDSLQDIVRSQGIQLILYNFLIAAPPSARPTVIRFIDRYNHDLNAVTKWLISVNLGEIDFDAINKGKSGIGLKKFTTELKTLMSNSIIAPSPRKGERMTEKELAAAQKVYFMKVKAFIESNRADADRLVSIYHKVHGTKLDSIQIIEPGAVAHESQKMKSYAGKLQGPIPGMSAPTKSVTAPTKSVPAPTKSVPAPTKSVPKIPWKQYFSSLNLEEMNAVKNTTSKLNYVREYLANPKLTTTSAGFVQALYNDYLVVRNNVDTYGQGEDRAKTAKYKIKSILLADPDFEMEPDTKYLDVGSGDGILATELAISYGVEDYLLSDVQDYLAPSVKEEAGDRFELLKPGKALRKRNDVVSSFQVLHHAGDLTVELGSLFKALTVGGKLLLSEHDVSSSVWHNLVLLEHIAFEISEIARGMSFGEFAEWFDDYDLKLTSFYTINEELKKLGFILVGKTKPSRKNATYYSVYLKN